MSNIWHHTSNSYINAALVKYGTILSLDLDLSWSSAPQGYPNVFPFKERFIFQKVKIKLKVVFHNQLRLCTCFLKSPTFRKRKLLKIKIKRKMGQPFSYLHLTIWRFDIVEISIEPLPFWFTDPHKHRPNIINPREILPLRLLSTEVKFSFVIFYQITSPLCGIFSSKSQFSIII